LKQTRTQGAAKAVQNAKQNAEDNALSKRPRQGGGIPPEQIPDLHATSESEYLKVTYLKEIGVIRVDEAQPSTSLGKPCYEVVAHYDVSDSNLRKMQDKVDEARKKDPELEKSVTQRHWLVYRILVSFLALFLVIFGYIKLEELTRGYYTMLLRLGAGAVVLLTVLALFLLPLVVTF